MFYIFHGPNQFSAAEALNRLKAGLGDPGMLDLNTTLLEGNALSLSELIHHAGAVPFLAPHRLVIVNNYLSKLAGSGRGKGDKEALNQLSQFLETLPQTTILVFMETDSLKANHPILKLGLSIDKCVHAFNLPPKGSMPRWIEERVKQKGSKIEPRAASALAEIMGDDLQALDNEIEKLTLYAHQKDQISLADVELLCPYVADSESFAMANAIGRKDAKTALDQLHKRLEEGQNPLAIIGGITAQFRGLLEVKSMAAKGLTPAQIARQKGWKSDYAAKMRLKEANNFSLPQLNAIFGALLEADLSIKTGKMEQTLVLDTLIARLCSSG